MPDVEVRLAEASPETGLGTRALRGILSGFAQSAVQRFVSFGSQLALAALLRPADFGLIGLATGIAGIVQSMTDVGVEEVLVRRRRRFDIWCAAAFWTMLALLSASGLAIAAIAPFAAIAYHAPGLRGLLLVLAISMPLGAFSVVRGVALRAELRFGFLAAWGSTESLLQALLTVGFAAGGLGAYSFVLPVPIVTVARATAFRAMWRRPVVVWRLPRPRLWRSLIGVSGVTFASKLCMSMIGQGDYVTLGLIAGHAAVGEYWFGFRLAAQPLFILAGNLSGVLFPTLVTLDRDRARQGEAAFKASRLLSTLVMPAAFCQAAIAAPLIDQFFARNWSGSVPVIQLLSVGLGFDAVSWIAGSLLAARGEFSTLLRRLVVQLPVFLLLAAAGARTDGAVGTAASVAFYYVATQPIFVWSVFRTLGVKPRAIASLYLKPAALGAVAVGAGMLAASLLPHGFRIERAVLIAVVTIALYAPLLRWLQPEVAIEIADRIRPFAGRLPRIRTGSSAAPSAVRSPARR